MQTYYLIITIWANYFNKIVYEMYSQIKRTNKRKYIFFSKFHVFFLNTVITFILIVNFLSLSKEWHFNLAQCTLPQVKDGN